MGVDYYDLAWHGWSRDRLEKRFENCARCGIRDMFWSVMTCGYSEYHSGIIPWYDGRDRREGSRRCAEVIRSFDGLAEGSPRAGLNRRRAWRDAGRTAGPPGGEGRLEPGEESSPG